jgi:iron-sulfur cluster repair protein YtfE (RIC family)
MRASTVQRQATEARRRRDRGPETDSLTDPIAWLDDDHHQQQVTCDLLERLIRNPRHSAAGPDIEKAYWCLGEALPLHIADEEEDVVPLLARRCGTSDRLGEISAVLRDNHLGERQLAEAVATELEHLLDGEPLARPVRFFGDTIRLYRVIRQHIIWENNVLIPLARRRLRDLDHPYLMEKMAGRRRSRPQPLR